MEIRIRTHEELRTDRVTIEITGTGAEVREVAEDWEAKLYTDGEVANLQASEAELVAGPLRRRIAELERTLAASVKRETDLEVQVQSYDHDRHTERDRADKAVKALAESRELVAFKNGILNDKDDELREVRGHADRITREHGHCAGKLELREKDADTFRRQRNELEARVKDLESKLMEGHVCTGGCSGNQHVAFVGRQALARMENQVAELTRRIDNARVLLVDSQVKVAQDKAVTKAAVTMAEAIGKVLDTLA